MWKITRLRLKNFIHIYAGMSKRDITLDLSDNDKRVNIFIGKMGSGKSSILGHLQPFATYGTLDVRNQEDLILPEEDGLKEIDFLHNGHEYKIQHNYSWNKSTQGHTVKSYIQLDGTELNDNGNVGSFKEIIRREFGIDQNFLRLLRLGPNVSNLINMKSTDRKSFIASLLSDTEIYMMLHKKLSEDYRGVNSAINLISSKLTSLSAEKEEEMRSEEKAIKEELQDLQKKADKIKDKISNLQGVNSALGKGKSLEELLLEKRDYQTTIDEFQAELDSVLSSLEEASKEDQNKVMQDFGKVSAMLVQLESNELKYNKEYEELSVQINKLRDFLMLQSDQTQLEEVEARAKEITDKYEKATKMLNGFSSSYSYAYLIELVNTIIPQFQMGIDEMCTSRKEVIQKIYRADSSLINWANKRVEVLRNTLIGKRKLLQNIDFSASYVSPIPLYRPPMCPTDQCPFIQSHPVTIDALNKDHRKQEIVKLQTEIEELELEIAIVEDCAVQYPRMQILKQSWESISRVLDSIGALQCKSLGELLTNLNTRTSWYNYDEILAYIEKVKMLEDYNELKTQYLQVTVELQELNKSEAATVRIQLEDFEKDQVVLYGLLEKCSSDRKEYKQEKERLEEIMLSQTNIPALQNKKTELEFKIAGMNKSFQDLLENIGKIEKNNEMIQDYNSDYRVIDNQYQILSKKAYNLSATLQEITSAKSSYEEMMNERNTLKLILGAVSAKDGIPLIMVKVFLEECKEIINDLISDIFEDDLEILEFDISADSNEFRIPYRVNGNVVPDIELASQGQQAVISIAMSFALCRKAMFDYNIMLLDEIDNSIHKSDRERFIMILMKQMQAVGATQAFLITHNDIFMTSGLPVNIIQTTKEQVDLYDNQTLMSF